MGRKVKKQKIKKRNIVGVYPNRAPNPSSAASSLAFSSSAFFFLSSGGAAAFQLTETPKDVEFAYTIKNFLGNRPIIIYGSR